MKKFLLWLFGVFAFGNGIVTGIRDHDWSHVAFSAVLLLVILAVGLYYLFLDATLTPEEKELRKLKAQQENLDSMKGIDFEYYCASQGSFPLVKRTVAVRYPHDGDGFA